MAYLVSDFIARLRRELGATTADEIWSDAYLTDLINEGSRWFARMFPFELVTRLNVAADQRAFDLPFNTNNVRSVQLAGHIIPKDDNVFPDPPGENPNPPGRVQAWNTWGTQLWLRWPARGTEVGTAKLVIIHSNFGEDLDTSAPTNEYKGPTDGIRLIVIFAAKEAWAWLDGQDVRRGRGPRLVSQTARYERQLDREVDSYRRKRSFTSRMLTRD